MSQENQGTDWVAEGQNAILNLLSERLVVPWFEAESRISSNGWRSFPKVQPCSYTNPEDPSLPLVKSLKNVPRTLSPSSPFAFLFHPTA